MALAQVSGSCAIDTVSFQLKILVDGHVILDDRGPSCSSVGGIPRGRPSSLSILNLFDIVWPCSIYKSLFRHWIRKISGATPMSPSARRGWLLAMWMGWSLLDRPFRSYLPDSILSCHYSQGATFLTCCKVTFPCISLEAQSHSTTATTKKLTTSDPPNMIE